MFTPERLASSLWGSPVGDNGLLKAFSQRVRSGREGRFGVNSALWLALRQGIFTGVRRCGKSVLMRQVRDLIVCSQFEMGLGWGNYETLLGEL